MERETESRRRRMEGSRQRPSQDIYPTMARTPHQSKPQAADINASKAAVPAMRDAEMGSGGDRAMA